MWLRQGLARGRQAVAAGGGGRRGGEWEGGATTAASGSENGGGGWGMRCAAAVRMEAARCRVRMEA